MSLQFKKFLLFTSSIVLGCATWFLLIWFYDPNHIGSIDANIKLVLVYFITSVLSVFIYYWLLRDAFVK